MLKIEFINPGMLHSCGMNAVWCIYLSKSFYINQLVRMCFGKASQCECAHTAQMRAVERGRGTALVQKQSVIEE